VFCPGVPFSHFVEEIDGAPLLDGVLAEVGPEDRQLLEHDRLAVVAFGPGLEEAADPMLLERAFDDLIARRAVVTNATPVPDRVFEAAQELARAHPEKVITVTAPINAELVTTDLTRIATEAFAREVDRAFLGFTPRKYLRPEDLCLARVGGTFCARRRGHPTDDPHGHLTEEQIYLTGDPDVAPPRGILAAPIEEDRCACPLQTKPHPRDYLKCDPESRWLP